MSGKEKHKETEERIMYSLGLYAILHEITNAVEFFGQLTTDLD